MLVVGHFAAAAGNEISALRQQQLPQCVALFFFAAGLPANP